MKILGEVLAELFSMFMADARMTLITLALVAIAAAALKYSGLTPVTIGVALLVGCLANVIYAAVRGKQRRG